MGRNEHAQLTSFLGVLGRFDVCLGALVVFWERLEGGFGAFWGHFMGCWGRLGVLGAFWNITIREISIIQKIDSENRYEGIDKSIQKIH